MLIGFVDLVPFSRLYGGVSLDRKRSVCLPLGDVRVMLGRFSPAGREQLQQAGGARGRRAALSVVTGAHKQQRERSDSRRAQDAHAEAQLKCASLAAEVSVLQPWTKEHTTKHTRHWV